MASLLEDIHTGSKWIVECFATLNQKLDYSLESLKLIDAFFDEQVVSGKPKQGGILEDGAGKIVFGIGAYVGETLVRNCPESNWIINDSDPEGELNISIKLKSGSIIWPAQKVIKRFKNGQEDSIFYYGKVLIQGEVH